MQLSKCTSGKSIEQRTSGKADQARATLAPGLSQGSHFSYQIWTGSRESRERFGNPTGTSVPSSRYFASEWPRGSTKRQTKTKSGKNYEYRSDLNADAGLGSYRYERMWRKPELHGFMELWSRHS